MNVLPQNVIICRSNKIELRCKKYFGELTMFKCFTFVASRIAGRQDPIVFQNLF